MRSRPEKLPSPTLRSVSTLDRLDAGPVQETVTRLEARIAARFPDRGLRSVAGELIELTTKVSKMADAVRDRLRWVRLASRAAALLVLAATVHVFVLAARDAVRRPRAGRHDPQHRRSTSPTTACRGRPRRCG